MKGIVSNQTLKSTTLTSERGTIYDQTGVNVLAQSASVWSVVLEPAIIDEDDRDAIADELSRILGVDRDYIYKISGGNSWFIYVKRKIEDDVRLQIIEALKARKVGSGVRFISEYKRYYPYGSLASSVLGFTGTDGEGLYGIEYQFDNELTGTQGRMVSLKDALGGDMPFQYEQMISAENGYDLVLTIDATVQSIVERHLEEGMVKYGVNNGATAVVMDVKTGGILAMASGNNFDLNSPFEVGSEYTLEKIELLPDEEQDKAYQNALYAQWRNKAISDTYLPGSVFKMITAAGALDCGAITENTVYTCTGSYVPFPGVAPIRCWVMNYGYNHGVQTVKQGLCNSCNPFFMQTALTMGRTNFYDYFEAFGFTEKTGIDLPGEAIGIYHTESALNPVELATASFGQGFTVTPIQMITGIATIANGGYLVEPHVVDRMLDKDGNIANKTDTSYTKQVISKDVSEKIIEYLRENVISGSATTGNAPGYRVAGKTGTSEKVDKWLQDTSKDMEYIVSYGGFAPADDPQYALLVYFDEPSIGNASGGAMAGPVFANIMSEILPYLGVESQLTESEYLYSTVDTPNLKGLTLAKAKEILKANGLEIGIYGDMDDTDIVAVQAPTAGESMPKEGKVVVSKQSLFDEKDLVIVPDFTGKTIFECINLAYDTDVQIVITGTSTQGTVKAQNQSIEWGTKVKPGTVIQVSVVNYDGLETTTGG